MLSPVKRGLELLRQYGLPVLVSLTGLAVAGRAYEYLSVGTGRHRAEAAAFWFVVFVVLQCLIGGRRQRERDGSTPFPVLWTAGIAIAAIVAFWPAFSIGLLSDDFILLPTGAACTPRAWEFVRPLPLAVWALTDSVLSRGALPVALHALNVTLHATNAALVVWLAVELGLPQLAALFAGFTFVLFPASVEAVAWASGIQDLLLVTGTLLFVLGTARARPLVMACGLGIALMSKETGVVVPVLAALALVDRHNWRELAARLGLSLLVCAALAAWRLTSVPSTAALQIVSGYQLKELLSRPFAALTLPWTRDEMRHGPVAAGIFVAVLIAAVTVASIIGTRRRVNVSIIPRSCAWIVVSALPVGAMFFVDANLEGSRYLYLGLVGFALGLTTVMAALPRYLSAGLMVAALLSWSLGVRQHLGVWREAAELRDETLASARSALLTHAGRPIVQNVPDSVRGAYVFRNGFREAVAREAGCAAAERLRTE
jgi:hypothetical protein